MRKLLHHHGYRFRLHRRDLPGTPDLVLPRHRIAVLVHGCFWHQHEGCVVAKVPKTKEEFWRAKFARNKARDADVERRLAEAGWEVIVIWECETKDVSAEATILTRMALRPKHESAHLPRSS